MDNLQMTQQEIAKAGIAYIGTLGKDEEIYLDLNEWKEIINALRLLEPVAAGTHMIVSKRFRDTMIAAAQEETP